MKQLRINSVANRIQRAIYSGSRGDALEEFLRCGAEVYVVAGAIRDALSIDSRRSYENARDFDIAVAGVRREFFAEVLQSYGMKNRHGGYVLSVPESPNWDVWRLEDSIGLQKTGTAYSLEAVLRTFNLDCNAIAMNLRSGLFLDTGAVAAVHGGSVSFAEGVIHHSHSTFAAKALMLNLRLNYKLSSKMNRFIARHLENDSLLHEALKAFPHLPILPPPSERLTASLSAHPSC